MEGMTAAAASSSSSSSSMVSALLSGLSTYINGAKSNALCLLGTMAVVAPICKRLGVSNILGFLAAGMALGPNGGGLKTSQGSIDPGCRPSSSTSSTSGSRRWACSSFWTWPFPSDTTRRTRRCRYRSRLLPTAVIASCGFRRLTAGFCSALLLEKRHFSHRLFDLTGGNLKQHLISKHKSSLELGVTLGFVSICSEVN